MSLRARENVSPAIMRRQLMWAILEEIDSSMSLEQKERLKREVTSLLKDIKGADIGEPPPLSNFELFPVWETICVAAHIGALLGWGTTKERRPQNYAPTLDETELAIFKRAWEDIRRDPASTCEDLLGLLVKRRYRAKYKEFVDSTN